MMRIHYLQHVPFEKLEQIEHWATQQNHTITGTRLFESADFPAVADFDMLVVLGGPMGTYDEDKFPWLQAEKRFIKMVIEAQKQVLGICLGAQLIADVLGAKVYKNEHKEIGWFPVMLTDEGKTSLLFSGIPEKFHAFHWHGDTFELPAGARHIAYSEGCQHQAFTYGEHVVGLQFHFESSSNSIEKLIAHCKEDLQAGIYVQTPEEMLAQKKYLGEANQLLYTLLEQMEKRLYASK